MPTITTSAATTRRATRPISAGRAGAPMLRMPPARSGAGVTSDQLVTADQVVLRRELVVHLARPQRDQELQPDEQSTRHDQDQSRAGGAAFHPDRSQDQRRDDEPDVVRDVVQRERAAA